MRRIAQLASATVVLLAGLLAAGCNEKKAKTDIQDPTVTPAPSAAPAPGKSNAEYFASDPAEGSMSPDPGRSESVAYAPPTMSSPARGSAGGGSSAAASEPEADPYGGLVASGSATSVTVAGGPTVHRVAKGDTLTKIARKYYNDGNRWKDIAKANGISKPDKIKVGQELVIP